MTTPRQAIRRRFLANHREQETRRLAEREAREALRREAHSPQVPQRPADELAPDGPGAAA